MRTRPLPSWLFAFLLAFFGVPVGCGPAAGPMAGAPATPRGPATALDGASTPTPTVAPPATPTAAPTDTPTAAPVPTDTPAPTNTPAPLPTSTPVPTDTPTPAAGTPTAAPTGTGTPVPSPQPGTPTPPSPNVDFAVQKTAQCNQSTGACTFAITVVNNGPGPYYGGVSIQDFITPTVPFVVTAFGGAGGTICYQSGAVMNCGPHYPLNLPPGGTYQLTLMVQVDGVGSFQNCATLQLQDLNPANNQSCASFGVTAVATPTSPDLAVQKTGQCNWPYTCVFTITVTNVGSGTFTGNLTVADQPNPNWSTLLAGGGSINAPPPCTFAGPSVLCQVSGLTLAPGQGQTFTFSAYFGPTGYKQAFQNCASIPPGADGNPANNQGCVSLQPPTLTPTPGP